MTRSRLARLVRSAILFVAVVPAACEQSRLMPTSPDRLALISPDSLAIATNQTTEVKGGKGGGGDALVADVIVGDSACPASPSSLASTAPGDVTDSFHVRWGHTQGLNVTPDGSSYSLTDDVTLNMRLRTNNMTLTSVTLFGQDIIGPDGIQHETDAIPISPQPVLATGFTLHVHAAGITVYKLSGHTGGKRVGSIGTICIGDVVYRLP